MNLFTKTLSKIFKSGNQQELSKIYPLVSRINELEPTMVKLKDHEFLAKTKYFKDLISKGQSINSLLPECFALAREAAKRKLGERPYDEQLIGGIILNNGGIAEMKTGEGKTLVSTLPAYLNSLENKGVHIVTVNDYLANRDAKWMGEIFKFLGITTGCVTSETSDQERKNNYKMDITYGTNNELGFDYLRDNMKYSIQDMVQRGFNYCIVDEVDSILIDESRTPLIISGRVEDKSNYYLLSNNFIKMLQAKDYELDEKNKNAILSDAGIDKIEKLALRDGILKNNNFYDPQNLNLVHHVNQALKANLLFKKDTDYIIKNGKVQIIDEFTGRVMDGRRFSDGLHQAIEAKENVEIQEENQTLASITYQNYFRLYKKLSGMTGTAMTESEEFFDIYKLNVISVPTHKKMIRDDMNDQIFRTEEEKYNAILNKVKQCNKDKQPVLVGTTSIEKSEKISKLFSEKNLKHNVLNAKHHEMEASIIAEAGKSGSITIATNMAGRGTDIKLGGNKYFSDTNNKDEAFDHSGDQKKVKSLGGLFIIGTERHESRRIDNQLRGRSGRQGDPGKSLFYLSLEDELMRIFGGDQIDGMLKKLGLKENESINHPWINKAIERAQKKVEARNFDIRKTLIKFDDVMNDQRQVIFGQRLKILKDENIYKIIDDFFEEKIKSLISIKNKFDTSNDEKEYITSMKSILGNSIEDDQIIKIGAEDDKSFIDKIRKKHKSKRDGRVELIGDAQNKEIEKKIFIQIIDFTWRSHLQYLEQLRQVIGLRSYGQKDPLSEFKKEAFRLFEELLEKIKIELVKFLFNINLVVNSDENKEEEKNKNLKGQKIGRNEKCPCGSEKKYKHCCGKI